MWLFTNEKRLLECAVRKSHKVKSSRKQTLVQKLRQSFDECTYTVERKVTDNGKSFKARAGRTNVRYKYEFLRDTVHYTQATN